QSRITPPPHPISAHHHSPPATATLSLHASLPIYGATKRQVAVMFAEERPTLLPLPIEPFRYYQYGERTVHLDGRVGRSSANMTRSEEHTSELQSPYELVCRLLLEKKKNYKSLDTW